ncbi:unnamed protein product [Notodromas monacha]|uniref:Endonuclease/exonuclease/phosphatase domain-containing protein n=1 Tax=Notodromas monacha TaxID=399045 RepID=A0A7R9BI78_9CRUS|nr:unnamed protein product [Notodromas monacha]CAG0915964.1 unnamed protein product [Notodromas monacha]
MFRLREFFNRTIYSSGMSLTLTPYPTTRIKAILKSLRLPVLRYLLRGYRSRTALCTSCYADSASSSELRLGHVLIRSFREGKSIFQERRYSKMSDTDDVEVIFDSKNKAKKCKEPLSPEVGVGSLEEREKSKDGAQSSEAEHQQGLHGSVLALNGVEYIDRIRLLANANPEEFWKIVDEKAMECSKRVYCERAWEEPEWKSHAICSAHERGRAFEFSVMTYNILAQHYVIEIPHLYRGCSSVALCWPARRRNLLREIVMNGCDDSFFIATTHLLYNPRRHDVRLAQMAILLAELDRLTFVGQDPSYGNKPRYKPVILCGDFNFGPVCPEYEFVTRGYFEFQSKFAGSLNTTDQWGQELRDEMLPLSVGITDTCQHVHVALERLRFKGINDHEIHDYFSSIGASVRFPPEKPRLAINERFWMNKCVPLEDQNMKWRDNMSEREHGEPCRVPKFVSDRDKSVRFPNLFRSGTLTHDLEFQSVYRHTMTDDDSTFHASTFQERWITVDHIFYTTPFHPKVGKRVENRLRLFSRQRMLQADHCELVGRIPTLGVPSDHYPLAARFLLYST